MTCLPLILLLFLLSPVILQAQPDNPPFKHWELQHGYATPPNADNEEHWLFDVEQTPDGGYVACGFSEIVGGSKSPSVVKYNAKGVPEWHKVYDFGYPADFGLFNDIMVDNGNHFVAVGFKRTPNGSRICVVRLNVNGTAVSGTPKLINLTYEDGSRGSGIVQADDGGYVIVGGSSCNGSSDCSNGNYVETSAGGDLVLVKLNASFVHQWNDKLGLAGGTDRGLGIAKANGDYFVTGWTHNPSGNNCILSGNNDLYIARYDPATSNTLWEKKYDADSYSSGFFTYKADSGPCSPGYSSAYEGDCADLTSNTDLADCRNNSDDRGESIIVDSDGNVVVSGYFHRLQIPDNSTIQNPSGGCSCSGVTPSPINGHMGEYLEAHAVLIKLNAATGGETFVKNIANFSGVDFKPKLTEDRKDDGYLVIGAVSNPNVREVSGMVDKYLIKTDKSGDRSWDRAFVGDNSGGGCGFGVADTEDGGCVVVGNNAEDGDNYVIVKFWSDCQPNATYDAGYEPGDVVEITSNTNWLNQNKIIGGHIVVKNGATLNITDGTYQFADTRQLNDVATLATNNLNKIARCGIQVQPGGALIVAKSATLRGLDEYCTENNMWEGIEVYGDELGDPTQLSGSVNIDGVSTTATIRDALCGVRGAKTNFTADGMPYSKTSIIGSTQGAIVSVERTDLINNYMDSEVARNKSGTYPYYAENDFVCNAALADPNFRNEDGDKIGTQKHLSLIVATKCIVEDSDFSNTYDITPVGIYIASSEVEVDNCTINDNQNGIYASYKLMQDHLIVENSDFSDNEIAAYVKGSPAITTFAYNDVDMTNSNSIAGFYMDGSENYLIHDNTFTGMGSNPLYNLAVITHNTGHDTENYISRNSFTDFTGFIVAGVYAWGDNGAGVNDDGLKIRCNTFTDNDYDIGVASETPGQGGTLGSVHKEQGKQAFGLDPGIPAGNVFSTCAQTNTHIYTSSNAVPFNYYYHNAPNAEPTCYNSSVVGKYLVTNFNSGFCDNVTEGAALLLTGGTFINGKTGPEWQALLANATDYEREWLLHQAVKEFLLADDVEAAISLLRAENTPSANMRLLGLLAQLQRWDEVQDLLNNLPMDKTSLNAYHLLHQLNRQLNITGNSFDDMNSSQENIIRNMADGKGPAAAQAQNILYEVFGEEYPIQLPEGVPLMETAKSALEEGNGIKVIPNPTKGNYMTIHIQDSEKDGGIIGIYNQNGKLIKEAFCDDQRLHPSFHK